MEKIEKVVEKIKKYFPEINITELLNSDLEEEFKKDIENLPNDYKARIKNIQDIS